MALDEKRFESLHEQVRELHRLADELTRSPRLRQHVRARLYWSRDVPSVPADQVKLADEVVDALATPRLSSSQSRRLHRAFFDRARRLHTTASRRAGRAPRVGPS
jgi:hypothetical protein